MTLKKMHGGTHKSCLFQGCDRLGARNQRIACPEFNFDDNDVFLILHDQVKFARTAGVIAPHESQPALFQPSNCQLFELLAPAPGAHADQGCGSGSAALSISGATIGTGTPRSNFAHMSVLCMRPSMVSERSPVSPWIVSSWGNCPPNSAGTRR